VTTGVHWGFGHLTLTAEGHIPAADVGCVPDPDSPRLNHLYITYITCMGEILFYTNTYS
jgi:hypothetical protein